MMPLGVVVPRSAADVEATIAIAREEGVPVTPRGGGTSQCGQTVNHGLIVDVSPHLREIVELDVARRRVRVQPGIVLDALNRALKPHGLFFPVDPSTASRCTIGGMTANNSSGARSIRYGIMADNVARDRRGARRRHARVFRPGRLAGDRIREPRATASWSSACARSRAREAGEIAARIPKVQRHVGGYAIQTVAPAGDFNLRQAAGRLRRNAGVLHGDRSRAAADPARSRARRLPLPGVRRRDALDAGARRARAGCGRARRPHDDRALARDRRVRADRSRSTCAGEPGSLLLGRIQRRRAGAASPQSSTISTRRWPRSAFRTPSSS